MKLKFTRKRVVAAIAVAAAVSGATLFATSLAGAAPNPSNSAAVANASGYHACLLPTDFSIKNGAIYPNDAAHPSVCYNGALLASIASTKGQSDAVANLQHQIDQLKTSKVDLVSTTGSTHVSNWNENGTPSWAVDDFNRTLSLTRQSAVEASKCGTQAVNCWLYTGSIADNGSFVANDGAPTPNSSDGAATIDGVVTGTMTGTATVQLYADGLPTAALPVNQNGRGAGANGSTTNWAQLAFPAGTHFGDTSLTGYDWTYTSPCESWTEHYVAASGGPEQQSGNITGSCPAQN